jgi:hypothetical protein
VTAEALLPSAPRGRFLALPTPTARLLLALLVVAAAGYAALWRRAPVTAGDSAGYMEAARDLSDGRLERLHDRTLGYPALLALTGSTAAPTRALFYAQLVLHAGSIWLLAAALSAAGAPRRLVLLLAVLLLLPPYAESAGFVLTETLTQFFLAAGVAGLALWAAGRSSGWLIVSAVGLALAALVRPTYQGLALPAAVALLLLPRLAPGLDLSRRQARRAALSLLAGALVVLGGYSLWNRARFGYFGLTPMAGFNLSTRTVPFIERLPEEHARVREELIRARDIQLVKRGGSHTGYQFIWSVRPRLAEVTGLEPVPLARHMLRLNLQLIREAPLLYLQEVARSALVYWLPSTRELASGGRKTVQLAWGGLHFLLLAAFAVGLVVLAGLALFRWSRRAAGSGPASPVRGAVTAPQAVAYLASVGIVLYTVIISCAVDVGHTRHRASTDALIVFAAVLGAHVWALLARAPEAAAPEAADRAEAVRVVSARRNTHASA